MVVFSIHVQKYLLIIQISRSIIILHENYDNFLKNHQHFFDQHFFKQLVVRENESRYAD